MKLRIVEYHNAKDSGCKEDIVWYIERVDDYGKVWITCWPVNAKAPYSCEGCDARMMYYSYALAKKCF